MYSFRSQSHLKGYKLSQSSHNKVNVKNRKQRSVPQQISKHINTEITSKTPVSKTIKNRIPPTEEGSFDILPTPLSTLSIGNESFNYSRSNGSAYENLEEARYNLATRVMSNGVEVIIAGDKSKPSDKPFESGQSPSSLYRNEIQIAPHQVKKPMTLAPSTLKNQMILLVPNNLKDNITIPINTNHFVTKTCLTTYTYRTTYLQDGKTTVESREKVIANIATEERNYPKIISTLSMGVTLTRTPQLAVGVFPTTYSYYYTMFDGESSKMLTSDHTVLNTITAPDDYILFLQPSEAATPVFDTNTYFNKVVISKTSDEGGVLKVMSNSETLTQVIVTESLPPRSTSVLTSYYAFDVDETRSQTFSTNYIPQSDNSPSNTETASTADYDMHIYATKTFLTTFTYLTTTTLFKSTMEQESVIVPSASESEQVTPVFTTAVNYYTRVIENVITEAIPTSLLNPELITKFRKELKRGKNQRSVIVTLATLLGGQTLEITAMKMVSPQTFTTQELHTASSISVAHLSSALSVTLNPSSTLKSTMSAKIPESNASEEDSNYEASELRPAVIKIKPEKSNKNATKVKLEAETSPQLPTNMNNLFSSLNLNGFTVLRPVFSAMADLLQSKFVSNADVTETKNALKNIASSSKHENNNENPIYIPVKNSPEQYKMKYVFGNADGAQNPENSDYDIVRLTPPQSLHIQPPEADLTISDDNWMHGKHSVDNRYIQGNNKGSSPNQQPLINGGIPIRPGEIITANSDVIVGKPNGIQQPKVYTLQSNLIPLRHGGTDESSTPFALPKIVPHYEQHKPNLYYQSFSVSQNYKYGTPKPIENYGSILRPPPPPQFSESSKLRQRPPLVQNLAAVPSVRLSNFESSISQSMDQSLDNKDLQHKYIPKIQNLNSELKNNEIIEIKRMPQIFSADILPEIKISQPSNLFSSNQYKALEPQTHFQLRLSSQYPNSSSNTGFMNSKANKFKYQTELPKPPLPGPPAVTPFAPNLRPHSNHHRINLQTNVLNHNVAINVPPLTFKKESEMATPVLHGVPSNSGHLIMPHIKIPANEVEVQVNLTPQHSVSQHHSFYNFLPNANRASTFKDFSVPSSEAPTKIPSKSNQYAQTLYQNRQHFQSSPANYPELHTSDVPSNFNTINLPIEHEPDVVGVFKPAIAFKSHYTNKPTTLPTTDSIDKWNMDWSKEELDSGSQLKTTDQIGAFSSFKNKLVTPQQSNPLGKFKLSLPDQGKKVSYPLLNPLTALQVNHLDETSVKNDSSAKQQPKKNPVSSFSNGNKFQGTTTSGKSNVTNAKQEDSTLYPKTTSTQSNLRTTSKLNESWKISRFSDVNKQHFSGPESSYKDTTNTHSVPNIPFSHGQPFKQNLPTPDMRKKLFSQGQIPNERIANNNLFIATGEAFKLNDKTMYSNANVSKYINMTQDFSSTKPTLLTNQKNETKSLKKVNTSKLENFHFEKFDNIRNENTSSTKRVESIQQAINPPQTMVNLQLDYQYSKPTYISYAKPLPKPTKSLAATYLPRSPEVVGLYPPPISSTSQLSKKLYNRVKNVYYKTNFETTPPTTNSPPTKMISVKPYLRQDYEERILDSYSYLTPAIDDYRTNWRHSTINRKATTSVTRKTKSKDFITSSKVHFSNSFVHMEDSIKQTTAQFPKLPQTSYAYSKGASDSKQSWSTQVVISDFEVADKNLPASKERSQIVLEPSMDLSSTLLISLKEQLPTTSVDTTPTNTIPSVYRHKTNTQDLERSTPPLGQTIQLTKFITNTVTTTKTTISTTTIQNEGEKTHSNLKTTTFHLTTTFTTTVVDTVTETHTLIQPTRSQPVEAPATLKETGYSFEPEQELNTQSTDATWEYEVFKVPQNAIDKSEEQTENNPKSVPIDKGSMRNNTVSTTVDSDNIFIVMTNRHGGNNMKTTVDTPLMDPNEDYSERINLDLATRDEELFFGSEERINNILLGGVLIATPTNSNVLKTQPLYNGSMSSIVSTVKKDGEMGTECRPACKTSRNEICKETVLRHQCICRPGFARMFPDRPCKPTYTYTMRLAVKRIGDFELIYNETLSDNSTKDFRELATITHDAIDRMVMQSDFRDVYHGVSLESFSTDDTNHALIANILLQFSDNNDEKRLEDVFKKYLRVNGYNIGLTDLYTDKKGAEMITVLDFNECNHSHFHDCSSNARCFNLKGTYTCSCNDGFIDLSENLVFPGRLCSAEIIGCEKCNFHGQCVPVSRVMGKENLIVCECFAWYSGAQCQLNLKILLITLMAVGTILFVILLICILLTCMKHRKPRKVSLGSVFPGIQDRGAKQSSLIGTRVNIKDGNKTTGFLKNLKPDKRAMIMDTSSESSDSSLPYVLKDSIRSESKKQYNKLAVHSKNEKHDGVRVMKEPFKQFPLRTHSKACNPNYYIETGSSTALPTFAPFQGTVFTEIEQSDRSLTVMIPRAKYHPSVLPQAKLLHHQLTLERTNTAISPKLNKMQAESGGVGKTTGGGADNSPAGALVSAGFEVSAIVNENILYSNNERPKTIVITHDHMPDNICSFNASDDSAANSGRRCQYEIAKVSELNVNKDNECHILNYNVYKSEDSHDSMDEWLDSIQQTTSSAEAHSFGDSMILLTKCDKSEHDNQTVNTNEEANTMAERDIGSTFLLPHTHLYKPERESDVSGLDSM